MITYSKNYAYGGTEKSFRESRRKKKKKISIHRGMIFGNEITIRNESIETRRTKKMSSLPL